MIPQIICVVGPTATGKTKMGVALAHRFGELLGREVTTTGEEAPEALLNNASWCHSLYGYPGVGVTQATEWVAEWIKAGGRQLGKATKFQTRDGKF